MLVLTMMPMGISALATTELALTNKRIIGRVRKQRLTVPFADIETVRVRRSLPGMIFNYGSITIIGNGVRVRFPGITKPAQMKSLIDDAVEKALFGDLPYKETATPIPSQPQTKAPLPSTKPTAEALNLPPAPKLETENVFAPKKSENYKLDASYKDPNTW